MCFADALMLTIGGRIPHTTVGQVDSYPGDEGMRKWNVFVFSVSERGGTTSNYKVTSKCIAFS